jgi:ribosomal protein S18 acetylase RimI-like enzyme
MIRLATKEDIPEMLRMGESFFNASGYGDLTTFNKEDTESLFIKLIGEGWLLTDGISTMLGFVVFPMFMNNSTVVAQELFWWVDESARGSRVGIEILKKAEELAKENGATAMMMLSINELNGDSVNKLYERLGYSRREQTYMRVL